MFDWLFDKFYKEDTPQICVSFQARLSFFYANSKIDAGLVSYRAKGFHFDIAKIIYIIFFRNINDSKNIDVYQKFYIHNYRD